MHIAIRHGGQGSTVAYFRELWKLEEDYGTVTFAITETGPGTPTKIEVDFGDSAFQVDTEANVIHKVRECLRRVDNPQHK